ncbi:MAG: Zn-dependent hydrolase [Chloroflexota bacterium]
MLKPIPMDNSQLRINTGRLLADFETLARIGATSTGQISRPALSLEDLEARAWFADRIEDAGFAVRDDDAGNLSGIMYCTNPHARTMMIGSHLDTVPGGSRYDGSIGVLAGLEIMRTVQEAGIDLPFHLEVMDFTDEEGTWFSMLGSRGLTGGLPVGKLGDRRGEDAAFWAVLSRAGIDVNRVHLAKRDPTTLAGYLELHIEQGTILQRLNAQIGIVRGIVGRTTFQMTFVGEGGHSGTTDIYRRKDALQGAALFITRAHTLIHDRFDGSVINCGNLQVYPGMFNVIPERATLTVECRNVEGEVLSALEHDLCTLASNCAADCNVELTTERVEHLDAATMDADMIAAVQQACDDMQLKHSSMISYAGHDAQPMSSFVPTGMVFIPTTAVENDRKAHNATWPDVINGTNVLLQTVLNRA